MKVETAASIHTLIFDLDGTLIDSSESILESYRFALKMHDITTVIPLTSAIIGPSLQETLTRLTGSRNPKLLKSLTESFKLNYDTIGYKSTRVFPGISKMLQKLYQSELFLYIATNKRLHPTMKILEHLGWCHYFQSIFTLDSKDEKFIDKSSMLAHIIKMFNIPIGQAAYVGDRFEDGLAANENQLKFILAKWGYNNFTKNQCPHFWTNARVPNNIFRELQQE